MALIKCPECGRDISDMASSCPSCGYVLKKSKSNNDYKTKNNSVLMTAVIALLAIVCVIWYQLDQSKKDNSTYNNLYYDSYYDYPKTGNAGALAKAKSYLKLSSFTRSKLIDQLKYNGFTYEQAVYGVEQNGL